MGIDWRTRFVNRVGLRPPAHSNLPIGSISAFKALESCKQLTNLVSEELRTKNTVQLWVTWQYLTQILPNIFVMMFIAGSGKQWLEERGTQCPRYFLPCVSTSNDFFLRWYTTKSFPSRTRRKACQRGFLAKTDRPNKCRPLGLRDNQ